MELHRQLDEAVAGIVERLTARGDRPGQLAVARIMGDGFRAMGDQWERVRRAAAELPGPVAAARDR